MEKRFDSAGRIPVNAMGMLLVGTMFSGCVVAPDTDERNAACSIETVDYDAAQDALDVEMSVRGLGDAVYPLRYTAMNIMSEERSTGRVAEGNVVTGTSGDGKLAVGLGFEADPRDQYRVLLQVQPDAGPRIDCGDRNFVFKQEDGQLAVESSNATTVCAKTLGKLILARTEDVDKTRYVNDPHELLYGCQ